MGTDPHDGVSANGWYVMNDEGTEGLAGPFCDRRVAHRHLDEMKAKEAKR